MSEEDTKEVRQPIFQKYANALPGYRRCPYSGMFIKSNHSHQNEIEAKLDRMEKLNAELDAKLEQVQGHLAKLAKLEKKKDNQ